MQETNQNTKILLEILQELKNYFDRNKKSKGNEKTEYGKYTKFTKKVNKLYKFIMNKVKTEEYVVNLYDIKSHLKTTKENVYTLISRLKKQYNQINNKENDFELLIPIRNESREYRINEEFIKSIMGTY